MSVGGRRGPRRPPRRQRAAVCYRCVIMAGTIRTIAAGEPAVENVLGPLGAAVMRVVWAQGEVTVTSVVSTLNAGRPQPLAYTTVMTILVRLQERGFLERRKQGRQFVYRPAADESAMLDTLSGRAVDDLLARYGSTAMRHFAERLADADPDLRARIIELASRRST